MSKQNGIAAPRSNRKFKYGVDADAGKRKGAKKRYKNRVRAEEPALQLHIQALATMRSEKD